MRRINWYFIRESFKIAFRIAYLGGHVAGQCFTWWILFGESEEGGQRREEAVKAAQEHNKKFIEQISKYFTEEK